MLNLRKSLILFFVLLYLPNGGIRSDSINENKIYNITSDSQSNSADGILKATGNVIIEGANDFNVNVKNYISNEVFIKEASGNKLIIFVDKGAFEFHKKEGQRVKTSIRF